MKVFASLLAASLLPGTAFLNAQTPAVVDLPNGVRLRLVSGVTVQVEVCAEKIIHVTAQLAGAAALPPSFMVTKQWQPVAFQVDATQPETLRLSTTQLQLRIDRITGAVSFLDSKGQPILSEQSRRFTPVVVNQEKAWTVEQTYGCASTESLYGLGQFQDGHWDWRGKPLQLQQINSEIAAPFLISNQGYGVLWDNASLTDFNPVDQEIPLGEPPPAATPAPSSAVVDVPAAQSTAAPKREDLQAVRNGVFTTGEAGRYVFIAKGGNYRTEFGLSVNGQSLIDLKNQWLPGSITGAAELPAHATVAVALHGGGKDARLYARPWDPTRTTFRSAVGDGVDYWFFYGPDLEEVIAGYRQATGAAPLWPAWAYGFWQCRERYTSQAQILDAVAEFRRRRIPVDLLVQDWRYWEGHGWSAAAWDEKNYPDPGTMITQLHEMHCKFMLSVWPNPAGELNNALKKINGLITGTLYDATNPAARAVRWQFLKRAFFDVGTDAWWQDADEPLDQGDKNMAGHTTFLGSGNRYQNAYPLFHNQGVYEGQRAADPGKRVVILSRSAYPGQQRYGAGVWSGDIAGTWDSLRRQIPAGLNFCLTGQPYWTTDCGGFFRPRDEYKSTDFNELQTRWYEFSSFCPILRIHGSGTATEIWNWLPETQKNLQAYDEFRHRMLPYTYSLAWQVTHAGSTMMRALPLDFRTDAEAGAISDEYLFGPALLVSPVTQPGVASRKVYLPRGTGWTDFWTGVTVPGGQRIDAPAPLSQIPLAVRAGSILPLGPVVQYAGEKPDAPIELRIFAGADGAFTLYEDEGDGYRYEEGAYAEIPLTWNNTSRTLTIGPRKGTFPGMTAKRTFQVVWVGPGHGVGLSATERPDAEISYEGRSVSVQAPAVSAN